MRKQFDAWIIEWRRYKNDGPDIELYGYSIHIGSVRKYLGDLYSRISSQGEIGLEVAFPGIGWGCALEAMHVKVDFESALGKALQDQKAIRTHGNSRALNHFHDEVEALALTTPGTTHHVLGYIPMQEAQRHTRLRRARARVAVAQL